MWIVYIIQHTTTKQIYSGFTSDLKSRLQSHNEKRNRSTIRLFGEWILVYAEAYRSKSDAQMRERKLKQYGSAKQRLLIRISNSLLGD